MAKDVITRFKLETTAFDSKIKQASKELSDYSKTATKAKEGFNQFTKANVDAAKALGTMATSSTNAKQKTQELVGAFNEAAKAYNNLTKEQQQSDFGKAMAQSLTQLQQRIRETKQEMQGLGNEMKNSGIFGGDKLSGMLQVFGGNLMTKAAGFAAGLASEMGDMIQQGIELAKQGEGIRIAFERLGRGDILDGLREATHGTVTDLELMKAAVKFNDFKLPLEELGTMLSFAQQKAKDTGQSVDYMVDSIVTGLGRKSLMILDNLGLSAAEIKDRMKETGDMTKAVGAIIRDQMSAAGDYVETAADRAAQANVNLQNKMEELGRKFAPVEEASNQLWTSMKIGILDIIGGPLTELLNKLTEAGRLKNALNDINGNGNNGNTQVGGKLKQLQAAKNSGASQYMLNTMQSSTIEGYNRQIMKADELLKQFEKNHSSVNVVLQNATKQFGQKFSSISELEAWRDAYKVMVSDYQRGAKEIMQPVKVNVDTSKAISGVDDLKKRLKDLEDQRKKAVLSGDNDLVDNLTKQINATKQNIGYLDPNALKTGSTKVNKDEFTEIIGLIGNAQERVRDLQKQISESWDNNEIARLRKELQGAQNELDVLQGKLPKDTVAEITIKADDKEALQKLENIDGVSIGPKTFSITATEEALPLLREIEGVTIDPKTFSIAATEEALPLLREIEGITISPKTFSITATDEALPKLQEIEGVQINSKTMTVTADTTDALLKVQEMVSDMNGTIVSISVVPQVTDEDIERSLREQYGKPIEVPVVPKTTGEAIEQEIRVKLAEQNMDADMQTLRTLLETQIKNGIEGIEIPSDTLAQAIMGEGVDIPDEYWSKLQDQINEKLKDLGIDALNIDFKTGKDSDNNKRTKNDDGITKLSKGISGLNSITGGLEKMGIEIPSEIQSLIGVIEGVMAVIQGVQTIIGITQTTALATNTAALLSLEAAIWANTASSLIPFANGGIVPAFANGGLIGKAAGGMLIPGNSFSGDNLRMPVDGGRGWIGVNSGELILSRSQQNNLATALSGNGFDGLNLTATIRGEQIRLALNNNGRRTGRGEYVQSTRR